MCTNWILCKNICTIGPTIVSGAWGVLGINWALQGFLQDEKSSRDEGVSCAELSTAGGSARWGDSWEWGCPVFLREKKIIYIKKICKSFYIYLYIYKNSGESWVPQGVLQAEGFSGE